MCHLEKENALLMALFLKATSKINSIPDPVEEINTLLQAQTGSKKWEVFTSVDVTTRKTVEPIIDGDFNGDGIGDKAALVVNTKNQGRKVAVVHGGTNAVYFIESDQAPAVAPWKQMNESYPEFHVIGDGVMTGNYIFFWDGSHYWPYEMGTY